MDQTTETIGVAVMESRHRYQENEKKEQCHLEDCSDDLNHDVPNTVKVMPWSFNFDNYSSMMVSEVSLPELEEEDETDESFSTIVLGYDDDDDDDEDSLMKAFQHNHTMLRRCEDWNDDPRMLAPFKRCIHRELPVETELDSSHTEPFTFEDLNSHQST